MYRTHHCNELRKENIDSTVTLIGWINTVRDHKGVIFVDLRDREGITQIVFRAEENSGAAAASHTLRQEDVIQVTGRVAKRLVTDDVDTTNENLDTGGIEIVCQELKVVSKAEVLPFRLDKELSNEDLRIRYRFLDLRRPRMAANLRMRHRVAKVARDYLDENGFIEVETPVLSKSTPEGARDFLVPSRLNPGKYYALPQAPQQYKQLLMVSGVERYFQFAKCFRDEDLRADRQPEFTQIDMEMSFVTTDDVITLTEGMLVAMFQEARGVTIPTPFERLTYHEAMSTWGSDKPDRRFEMRLTDVGEVFANSSFKVFKGALEKGGVVKAINAKGFAGVTTGQINNLTEMAQLYGAKGLAFIKSENDEWKSPIVKFFSDEEKAALTEKLNIEEGDLVLFGADKWETVCEVLGRIRLQIAEYQNLLEGKEDELDFHCVVDFPLFGYNEEDGKWNAMHHPFTRPKAEDVDKLKAGDYENIRAEAYDIVLNGNEVCGGSIRIHEADLQQTMFKALGISDEEQENMFGHLLRAFSFGAPPHGGIAVGYDRLIMIACKEKSIREVIAFPKNNRGADLMSESPAAVDFKQLRELYLKSTFKEKAKTEEESEPAGN